VLSLLLLPLLLVGVIHASSKMMVSSIANDMDLEEIADCDLGERGDCFFGFCIL